MYFDLSPTEKTEVEGLITSVQAEQKPLDRLLEEDIHIVSEELPARLREYINRFIGKKSPYMVVRGFDVRDEEIGGTPLDYPTTDNTVIPTREELFFLLLSSRLGEIFTWDSIQGGRIINEVIPIERNQYVSTSSGSKQEFGLHTEDSFTPLRGEYFTLGCLRNHEQVATTLSTLDSLFLPEAIQDILFQARFFIKPNVAHCVEIEPNYVPILTGEREHPSLRINTMTTEVRAGDVEAANALGCISDQLRKNVKRVILNQGELLVVNNLVTAHGREAYEPKYDGADRWLKRLYVTTDLGNSRHLRESSTSRIIRLS